jgi:hypothetical protein
MRSGEAIGTSMARAFPEGWQALQASGAAERELQTLAQLAAGLSDRFRVYHGVHWTRANARYSVIGEIDFVVVGPGGKLLLIEQKSGFLSEGAEGLCKPYGARSKNVAMQMARNAQAFITRLHRAFPECPPAVDSLLYCPDYKVKSPGSAGIDPARIVDATRRDRLLAVIREILADDGGTATPDDRIHRFLADVLELVADVTALTGEAEALSTRLAGGLAHWGRQIRCRPQRLHVTGTAGSGKTQLALAVFGDAVAAGRRPLYVCYNRPLAEHFRRIAPSGGEVVTYHQLAHRVCLAAGVTPDFARPDAFAAMEAALDRYQPTAGECCDVLVIDEGQDFEQQWCTNLLRLLAPDGDAWILEDPLQNLYGRAPLALEDWVHLQAATNYRSPQDIVLALNKLLPLPAPIESGSPLTDSDIDFISYRDAGELAARTVAAITRAIGLGFKRRHIAVVTFRGREHSALSALTRIGPYPLIAPTGRYDLFGNPIMTGGDIVIDSVHRFKGRAAPCVVLTEVDFEALDERAIHRIFVGATRATMKLILVISERAERLLAARLANPPASPEKE